MNAPTDVLRDEHRVILSALDVLERAAESVATGGGPPDAWWASAVAWLRQFADRTHHAKEEAALFPAMVKAGVPSEGGPIEVMLDEHRVGRMLVTTIAESPGGARVNACRAYIALLRGHILKENEILFPLADAVLDEAAVRALRREFEMVEVEQGTIATIAAAEAALQQMEEAIM
jgi:hemerythrin-like domain-containing protein